ncbi:hypothetical protein [Phormidium sp. CCY1219]|uniref:hypothetical protein n=1 Tax=Phormidium sp. CCY1219 TaxID=2886104 RepID=UPI002D1EB686|nr:hypothetical protein [Phormidium sp. CCY1219]MEB3826952.1 hypothetical protein [Phormidium sp. CCY1219]
MNINPENKAKKAIQERRLSARIKALWENKKLWVGVKLSLLLNDTVDATNYDAYICQWLANFYPDYDSYALAFWVDYVDIKRVEWEIFVLRRGEGWQLVKLPNPYCDRQS